MAHQKSCHSSHHNRRLLQQDLPFSTKVHCRQKACAWLEICLTVEITGRTRSAITDDLVDRNSASRCFARSGSEPALSPLEPS